MRIAERKVGGAGVSEKEIEGVYACIFLILFGFCLDGRARCRK